MLNDYTRILVFIKYGELHVLNSLKSIISEIWQENFAKTNALNYFTEIYAFVNDMDEKLLDLYPDIKDFVKKETDETNQRKP